MSTVRWNVDAAQQAAVAHYRGWSARLQDEARDHEAKGQRVAASYCWEMARIASAAAEREQHPSRPEMRG